MLPGAQPLESVHSEYDTAHSKPTVPADLALHAAMSCHHTCAAKASKARGQPASILVVKSCTVLNGRCVPV